MGAKFIIALNNTYFLPPYTPNLILRPRRLYSHLPPPTTLSTSRSPALSLSEIIPISTSALLLTTSSSTAATSRLCYDLASLSALPNVRTAAYYSATRATAQITLRAPPYGPAAAPAPARSGSVAPNHTIHVRLVQLTRPPQKRDVPLFLRPGVAPVRLGVERRLPRGEVLLPLYRFRVLLLARHYAATAGAVTSAGSPVARGAWVVERA